LIQISAKEKLNTLNESNNPKNKEFVNWSPNGKVLLNVGDEIMRIYEFDHKRKIFTIAREIHNKEDIHHRRKNVEKMAISNWSCKGKYCITCFNLASIADGDHMPIATKIFIYNA